jgi:chemotaxis protein methyltransferase CheR
VSTAAAPPLTALSWVTGLELAAYRPAHVDERIRRAVEREGVRDEDGLVRLLRGDSAARSRFRRSVAVSVSGLFRDRAQFELLERELLPPLIEGGRRINVWSAGCADGTELYSVAILLERLGALDRGFLLGSDVLEENVSAAVEGPAPDPRITARIRQRVRFERRDVLRDGPPAGRWRLIVCRNLAIYLAPAAKQALHELLSGALADDGVLLLGRSERIVRCQPLGLEHVAPHAYRRVR